MKVRVLIRGFEIHRIYKDLDSEGNVGVGTEAAAVMAMGVVEAAAEVDRPAAHHGRKGGLDCAAFKRP